MKNDSRGINSVSPHDVTSPTATAPGEEDEKTAEDKAEEKKKMDMMRKFYRNRHTSFI